MNGDDLEQRAFAAFTLARCLLSVGAGTKESLQQSLFYLNRSEADYMTLEMYKSLTDVRYLISVVYHNLGQEDDRDRMATSAISAEASFLKMQSMGTDEEFVKIWEVVAQVGVALAAR